MVGPQKLQGGQGAHLVADGERLHRDVSRPCPVRVGAAPVAEQPEFCGDRSSARADGGTEDVSGLRGQRDGTTREIPQPPPAQFMALNVMFG